VLVQGNQWLCGGVPRAVLPLLGPLNGTFLAFPCFASPTLLPLAANESEATLSANTQVPATVWKSVGQLFSTPANWSCVFHPLCPISQIAYPSHPIS